MDPRYQEMATENELAVILSHYNSDFVYSIVYDQINRTLAGNTTNISAPPNVVGAWEQNFKAIIDQYGAEGATQIQEVRSETYHEIIDIICEQFNLQFTIADIDIYTAAYTLYEYFVCNIMTNIISFFAHYIYKERTSIYEGMGLSELKKNKDSSTIYGKRMYKDIKLAVINANITRIIDNICKGMEFDFSSIITASIDDKAMVKYMLNTISDKGNFFQDYIIKMVNINLAEYVTGIRFALQEYAISHDQIIYTNASQAAEAHEAE